MQVTYDGAHSLLIGGLDGVHTWNDWHLIPTQRPSIAPPEVHKNSVEVPGMNGVIDMTDVLLGYPTYGQRTGSIDFYVDHTVPDWSWDTAYDTILNWLHGKKTKLILTDAPSFYYEGRLSVNSWKSDKMCSTITLDYDLAPFKKMVWSTIDNWEWDPFDFQHGVIIDREQFIKIVEPPETKAPTDGWFTLPYGTAGTQPIVPRIRIYAYGTFDETATKNAGGLKFRYKFSNGVHGTTVTGALDFFDADVVQIGTSMSQFEFVTPDFVIGSPNPNYIFSYQFECHPRNSNDEPLRWQYGLDFTPGRL